jgi:AcrR family transcriptional regulator
VSGVSRQRPRSYSGDRATEIAIFDATERLLAEQPLHELSVAQIVKAAGVSRAIFYHYFSSKYEVVSTLMGEIFDRIFTETQPELAADWDDPGAALRSSLKTALDSWSAHRAVINAVLENQHAVPELASIWKASSGRFAAVLADQIRRERQAGRTAPGLPPEAIATMLVCGAERIFYVGTTGVDPRLAKANQQLDAIVTIALAAIYGNPIGPVAKR